VLWSSGVFNKQLSMHWEVARMITKSHSLYCQNSNCICIRQ